jgi:mannose-6-phosphate isomerase
MLEAPLVFIPLPKERVWGGRRLEERFGKSLPPGVPIGESWEICDRPDDQSVVADGPLAGASLRQLMEGHGPDLMGRPVAPGERFPWLVKILDCRDDLSLQVHPPADKAVALRGEPKTEMWYFAEADPGAGIYVGFEPGVTRQAFTGRLDDGTVAGCFRRIPTRAGDAMFLPSGRAHALGAGNLVFEIQQNSDTTYRVFDWNRTGLDGKPRELHRAPALESIDFSDTHPERIPEFWSRVAPGVVSRPLVRHALFAVDLWRFRPGAGAGATVAAGQGPVVLGGVSGTVRVQVGDRHRVLSPGRFLLIPAAVAGRLRVDAVDASEILRVADGS